MTNPEPKPGFFDQLRGLRTPIDYFSEARSDEIQGPDRILCFARRSWAEARAEPLWRQHHHRYVLIVPWKESGAVQIDARSFSLGPPQALLVFPFQFHQRFHFSRRLILWQYVTFEAAAPFAALLEALRPHPLRNLQPDDLDFLRFLVEAWAGRELATRN